MLEACGCIFGPPAAASIASPSPKALVHLTTFSAFSVESLVLLQRGDWALAAGHTFAHVLGALACAALGYRIVAAGLG